MSVKVRRYWKFLHTMCANKATPHQTRNALLALALIIPAPSVGVAMAMIVSPGTVGTIVFFVCKVWMLALPLVWLLVVDRDRISLSRAVRGGFGPAIGLGFFISIAIFGTFLAIGPLLIDADHVRVIYWSANCNCCRRLSINCNGSSS